MPDPTPARKVTLDWAQAAARERWGIDGEWRCLPGYYSQNFLLTLAAGERFVLKVATPEEPHEVLDLQNKAMQWLGREHPIICPEVRPSLGGREIEPLQDPTGANRNLRLLTFLPGVCYAHAESHPAELLLSLGAFMARLDRSLSAFAHPAAKRHFIWDLRQAPTLARETHRVAHPERRRLVESCLERFEQAVVPHYDQLRTSVIHNDANDHNLLVEPDADGAPRVCGIIDFGDVVETFLICELAIASAYAVHRQMDVVQAASQVISGYHRETPLEDLELDLLPHLICARLCTTVLMAARERQRDPHNDYISVSVAPAWRALEQFACVETERVQAAFRCACQRPAGQPEHPSAESTESILRTRQRHLGAMLSISYRRPLQIVRGSGQYLFDADGRAYLDVVNNVCHVGHCHPKVVDAGRQQMALLNTNTRYLHEGIVRYAQRLCATMPPPLSVCFMVCSGSEANDLAMRLARAHTGGRDVVVVDGGYHGSLSSLVELSPYKFDGPGGEGAPSHVHKVPTPDAYRGNPESDYATHVGQAVEEIQSQGRKLAAFICEPLLGCAGQIILPEGYLRAAYQHVRDAGGLCIADEVQVGFGRVGPRQRRPARSSSGCAIAESCSARTGRCATSSR